MQEIISSASSQVNKNFSISSNESRVTTPFLCLFYPYKTYLNNNMEVFYNAV